MDVARFGVLAVSIVGLTGTGCYGPSPSRGGGQTTSTATPRSLDPAAVAVPDGYVIKVVARGLTYPTAVAFDDRGRPHVVEAGYSYGEHFTTPRLVRIEPDGSHETVATGDNGPWTDAAFHAGAFFVAQGGAERGGAIVRIDAASGTITPLIDDLPSNGDHHTNGPAIGPDGMLYFGIGTATNSGIVGPDNFAYGWLARDPSFHDLPPRDVTLAGRNVTTDNPLTRETRDDEATTGAYVPFGTPTTAGQVIKAVPVGNGAVYRLPVTGGTPELVAWGLRNPFGLAFAPGGGLYVTENSYDDRGARPVWGTGDLLWRIDPAAPAAWHGWPDFHAGEPLNNGDRFQPPGKSKPEFLLAEHPNDPPKPVAWFGVHSSASGIDFSRSDAFGHPGQAFVATFGDMAPDVGKVMAPVGYDVSVVDVAGGVVLPFAVNRGTRNGPASKLKTGGFERPITVRFDPAGDALYVVDFGVVTVGKGGVRPVPGSGALWLITREGGR